MDILLTIWFTTSVIVGIYTILKLQDAKEGGFNFDFPTIIIVTVSIIIPIIAIVAWINVWLEEDQWMA